MVRPLWQVGRQESHPAPRTRERHRPDPFVQAWYQGGVTLFDFTDPAKPGELAYYDRGPLDETTLVSGGAWSAYWYRGRIWANEIARGFDVLAVSPALVGDAARVREPYLNAQTQEPLRAPATRR